MAQKPLTPKQHKAAGLFGQGWRAKDVAAEVGVSTKTLRRWKQREDFRSLIARSKDAALSDNPTARETLEAALNATHANGSPDWRTRVSAARALVGADGGPDPDESPVRETIVHAQNLDAGGDK